MGANFDLASPISVDHDVRIQGDIASDSNLFHPSSARINLGADPETDVAAELDIFTVSDMTAWGDTDVLAATGKPMFIITVAEP
jgi:hypothetical protein